MRALVIVMLLASVAAHAEPDPDPYTFWGTTLGSPGSFFGTFALGQTAKPTFPTQFETMDIELERSGQRIDGVIVSISDTTRKPPLCPALLQELVRVWGIPSDRTWTSHGQVMSFSVGDPPSCSLHFRRAVRPEDWLGTTVPIRAIGKPVAELVASLAGSNPTAEEAYPITGNREIRWYDVDTNGRQIDLTAYARHGRVVGVLVSMMQDRGLAAWKQLIAKYGKPATGTNRDGIRLWTWRGIALSVDNDAEDDIGPADPHPAAPNPYSHTSILFGRQH